MKEKSHSERLMSLDALRGADMLFIMGFSGAIVALCEVCGFGRDCWLATQMTHVAWHGFRHHDTIFPLFLFLAGVSWPFSYAKQVAMGRSKAQIVRKILLRAFCLFAIGLMWSDLFSFNWRMYRWDSVLAHIGICWAGAALIFMFVKNWRVRLGLAAVILVGYWLMLVCFRAPDAEALLASTDPGVMKKVASYATYGTDNFSFTGNIVGWFDRTFMPGRLHEGIFDPDGLLCKLTGLVTAMLGTFAGELLRRTDLSGNRKTLILLGAGVVSLLVCLVWMPWCPVNKKIWTPTFVLAAGSYSFIALAVFYWMIDVKGWRRWSFFFRVIGMNAITIYVIRRVVPLRTIGEFFLKGVASWGDAAWSSLVLSLGEVAVGWLILWFLYRKKVFLKV